MLVHMPIGTRHAHRRGPHTGKVCRDDLRAVHLPFSERAGVGLPQKIGHAVAIVIIRAEQVPVRPRRGDDR